VLTDTSPMRHREPLWLLREGVLDAELASLLWMLVGSGVPLVVAGEGTERAELAATLLSLDPTREWVVLDTEVDPLTTDRLVALLRGGIGMGVLVHAVSLEGVLERLAGAGLPEDAARRLGVVAIVVATATGPRFGAVHYLRPTERDGRGHVQRRPPAVLATWDPEEQCYEHYAWGITPELADRVERSQADFESRQRERAAFLAAAAGDDAEPADQLARIRRYLRSEPPREAPEPRRPTTPSRPGDGSPEPAPDPHLH
jgi:hypothetical protein